MKHLKRHLGFHKKVTSLTTARSSPHKDLQMNPEKQKHIASLDNLTQNPQWWIKSKASNVKSVLHDALIGIPRPPQHAFILPHLLWRIIKNVTACCANGLHLFCITMPGPRPVLQGIRLIVFQWNFWKWLPMFKIVYFGS